MHYFLQGFFKGFCSCFLNPFFLMLAFWFCWFCLFFVFLFTSCCCLIKQVAMLWLLFAFLWASLVLLCVIFWIVFFLLSFVFWGGFKGQVRWPKGPPHLALSPPYLVYFVLVCFFVFFCWVLFCLLFWLLAFWKGFRVR